MLKGRKRFRLGYSVREEQEPHRQLLIADHGFSATLALLSWRLETLMNTFLASLRCFSVALCFLAFALVKTLPAQQPASPAGEPTLPYSPSLDLTSMDKSADPCVDFYQYSCGGWQKKNPIPPDQTSWGVYGKLYQDNLNFLRGILEQAAVANSQRDAVTQEIGDFYSSCMDEKAVEKAGAGALKPDLMAIEQLKASHDMAPVVARMQLNLG